MSPEEMIAVIQAHAEGKTIEARKLDLVLKGIDRWIEPNHIGYGFDFINWEYRIKPEPREPRVIWVNEEISGALRTENYMSEEAALGMAKHRNLKTRKFLEVIE